MRPMTCLARPINQWASMSRPAVSTETLPKSILKIPLPLRDWQICRSCGQSKMKLAVLYCALLFWRESRHKALCITANNGQSDGDTPISLDHQEYPDKGSRNKQDKGGTAENGAQ